MSVTYLMQYSVQYIIAPVIFDGETKTEGLAHLRMKKAKVDSKFSFPGLSTFLVGTELSTVT